MALQRVKKEPLTEVAYKLIRDSIITGELPPGAKLTVNDRIGNSTTFPEVFQHLPPIVNRNFPPGSSDLSWNPCLFP